MANNPNWAAEFNGDEDEDEALRIAIAMSLGEEPQSRKRSRSGVVDLTQDEEEDGGGDNRVECGGGHRDGESSHGADGVGPSCRTEGASPSLSALGLDRKKMEEERLARLNKRKVSEQAGSSDSRPTQRPRTAAEPSLSLTCSTSSMKPSPSAPSSLSSIISPPSRAGQAPSAATTPAPSTSTSPPLRLPFPKGVVKNTWAFGHPRRGDDIKIEEVLQKHHLQLAVLSSYQWDEEWLLSKIDIARTKLVLVAFAASEKQKEEMRSNVPRDRIQFCFPPMQPMGSMHSKLQLLKYERYLRIVIPTGNLMSFDWGETGTMENMVFIIDLPKFQTAEEREAQELAPFAEELSYFLQAQGLDEKLVSSLRNYDFTETRHYAFVHTIPGSHTAEDAWKRTGYCGLGTAVSNLGLSSSTPVEMDFICASLGAVNYSLLTALYYACQGDSGLKEYSSRAATAKGKGSGSVRADGQSLVRAHTRVYFPSRETVLQSKGGPGGAGTICCQSKWWSAPTFPREVLRDCRSTRQGLLMHSKVIFVRRHRDSGGFDDDARCFAYVGSANLSESAWGRLVSDRATGSPKLTCRNWECGVVVTVRDSASSHTHQGRRASPQAAVPGLDVFEGSVPVPMEWPGEPFTGDDGSNGSRTPWFYQES
ncbi:hypothetical protein VTI74DRAFT_723 [Chaetomium olivicolor]